MKNSLNTTKPSNDQKKSRRVISPNKICRMHRSIFKLLGIIGYVIELQMQPIVGYNCIVMKMIQMQNPDTKCMGEYGPVETLLQY